jgi:hypothetical protein
LQPINADGTSAFKINKGTIPVKFRLTGGSAGITNLVAHLTLTKLTDNPEGHVIEAVSTAAADTGNQFRYDASANQYIFNLSTSSSNMSTGTWLLTIDMHDGVLRTVEISLK